MEEISAAEASAGDSAASPSLDDLVEPVGLEQVLQNRTGHDANRAPLDERLENSG